MKYLFLIFLAMHSLYGVDIILDKKGEHQIGVSFTEDKEIQAILEHIEIMEKIEAKQLPYDGVYKRKIGDKTVVITTKEDKLLFGFEFGSTKHYLEKKKVEELKQKLRTSIRPN